MQYHMRSGTVVDFTAPKPTILLDDILFSLARENRYYNQTDYSVLKHSLAVGAAVGASGASKAAVIYAYVHDFAEAFLRDLPSFVKTEDYKALEDEIFNKIMFSFGVDLCTTDELELVKDFDEIMRFVEAWYLFPNNIVYSAIIERYKKPFKPAVLILCTEAFLRWHEVDLLTTDGEVQPCIADLFRKVMCRF